jgi:predicted transcriptional regulator
MTQVEMENRLGTSQQVISLHETGRREPTFPTLKVLLAACDLELSTQLEPINRVNNLPSQYS